MRKKKTLININTLTEAIYFGLKVDSKNRPWKFLQFNLLYHGLVLIKISLVFKGDAPKTSVSDRKISNFYYLKDIKN